MTDPDASARLDRLERLVNTLTLDAAERARLEAGVDRLGQETSALTRVLYGLDDTTRRVAALESSTVSDVEVRATVEAEGALVRWEVNRRWHRILAAVGLLAAGGAAGFYWTTAMHETDREANRTACQQRVERLNAEIALFRGLQESEVVIGKRAPALAREFRLRSEAYGRAIDALEAERPDCRALFG